jgi:hypothetical protein
MNVTRNTARTASITLLALLPTAACASTQAASTQAASTPAIDTVSAASPDTSVASETVAVATAPPPPDTTQPPTITVDATPASTAPAEPTPLAAVDQLLPTQPTTPPKPDVGIPAVLVNPPSTCGVAGTIPGDASNVESMLIDVDADGQADTVTTYFAAIGDSAGWHLRSDLANGPLDDIAIEGVGPGAARILGPAQVDYTVVDPATWPEELLVQAGANSSGVNLGVFGLDTDGCLFRYRNEVGDDLVLPVHETIGTLSGVRCDAVSGHRFLVQLQAEHSLGSMYAATETILARTGDALLPDGVISSDIDADVQVDWLNQFGTLQCGSTEL